MNLGVIHLDLIVTFLFSVILQANAYSYKDANNWGKKYPKCRGKNQSPFITDSGVKDLPTTHVELVLTNFDELPRRMTMKNTGHTVELRADCSGKVPTISGGPLKASYVFEKLTFLWAPKPWSEVVGVEKEPLMTDMEMHLFFYKTGLKSFENAESKEDGLAILKVSFSHEVDDYNNHVFDNLVKNLHKVHAPNSTAVISPIPIFKSLLDAGRSPFDFFKGSLNYPPCSESVTWIRFEPDYPTDKNLLKALRKIKLDEGDVSNVRPPQAANGRQPTLVYLKGEEE